MKNHLSAYHIVPLSAAIVLFWVLVNCCFPSIIKYDHTSLSVAPNRKYFANYKDDPSVENLLRQTLGQGSAIVVMGSSEMSADALPAIPYNFFNKVLGIPCIGLGHAGNQCFSIYSQLCSMGEIKKAKVVVMLSPGWFTEYGRQATSMECFLEFNDERFLYNTCYNSALPDIFKNYIGRYLADRMSTIESPSAIIKLFACRYYTSKNIEDRLSYWPYRKMYEAYCSYKVQKTNQMFLENKYEAPLIASLKEKKDVKFPPPYKIDWDSLYNIARKQFATKCTNNQMSITDDYYNTYMKDGVQKIVDKVEMVDNEEFRDFTMLVKLLQYFKSDAYFVMQPVNPYAYSNPEQMTVLLDSIKDAISKAGFGFYNMYATNKNSYEKGTLDDPMHLGDLGWYKVDSAIYYHFIKNRYE